jgi:hypothetical protein
MKKRALSWSLLSVLLLISMWPSALAQPEAFSYRIEPGLAPAVDYLPATGGVGDPRPVGAVLEPDGVQGDYVVNEVILYDPSVAELAAFTETYEAEIVFGGSLPSDPGNLPPDKLRPGYATIDDYLLRVNLDLADLSQFEFWMEQLDYHGEYAFSSDEAMRVVAIMAKERLGDLDISLNPLMLPPPQPGEAAVPKDTSGRAQGGDSATASANCVMCKTEEYSATTAYANSFTFSWLNDADLRVTRAWQYYDLLEYTPSSYPVLAMVDFGFAINSDFAPQNIPQYDFVTESYTTNGNANTLPTGGSWHGTGTLGLAAARLNNRFGTAGTGGQVAFPYLFRPEGTLYGAGLAIRTAVYWGADVVNVSMAGEGAGIFEWLALTKAASKASDAGVIVLVTAGNNSADGSNYYPCNTPGFLCVGGIDMATKQAHSGSNYGSVIKIWAPYNGLSTTPNPSSGGSLVGFGGTCGASAYAAGVVTLMRAVNPTLDAAGAASLIQATATNPAGDSKLAGAGGVLNAYGAVKAAAESAGLSPGDDAYEPNDTSGTATSLTAGTRTATIAPEDVDYYAFTTTDLTDVQLRVSCDDVASPNNSVIARLDGAWGAPSGGTITLDKTYLPPGTHVLEIYGAYTDTINCYHIEFATSASAITPDQYDDQKPPGEPRNDSWANRAIIPGTVDASILIPNGQITDVNFDAVNDVDFFEVTLAPATDPQSGDPECLGPGDPGYGDPGFSQGRLEISAWPDAWKPSQPGYSWPFQLTVYTGTGSVFTSTTGLRLAFECPHQHFPDGKIRFSVKAQDGRRNFYRTFIHYSRANVYLDIPIWVWTQTEPPLLRVVPPWAGLMEFRFPRDPAVIQQWAAGTPPDPMPPDYGAFYWEGGDVDLYLLTQGGQAMQMTLLNEAQEELGTLMGGDAMGLDTSPAAGVGHLHVPDLEPGTYILAFEGDFGAVYSVSVGPPYYVFAPLMLRGHP